MSKADNVRRAVDLAPGQRLPGPIFGDPAESRYLVKGVEQATRPEDAGYVRVSAVAESGSAEVSVLMRSHRRVRILSEA